MIVPILAYGHPILREKSKEISAQNEDVLTFIEVMWETMYNANGCGLAAVQLGQPLSVFVVDSKSTFEILHKEEQELFFDKNDKGIKETFINARIVKVSDKTWKDKEGCLSIPGISAPVKRPWEITVEYEDINFIKHCNTFSGLTARMIQHEYDHTQGILFIDYLAPVSRRLFQKKLNIIQKNKLDVSYPLKFIK